MSRRVILIYAAWFIVSTIFVCGVMIGMSLLGARDELNVVVTIFAFGVTAFLGGFLPPIYPPDRR